MRSRLSSQAMIRCSSPGFLIACRISPSSFSLSDSSCRVTPRSDLKALICLCMPAPSLRVRLHFISEIFTCLTMQPFLSTGRKWATELELDSLIFLLLDIDPVVSLGRTGRNCIVNRNWPMLILNNERQRIFHTSHFGRSLHRRSHVGARLRQLIYLKPRRLLAVRRSRSRAVRASDRSPKDRQAGFFS